jgi:drug/metabolite transporter (DMT)-like permease
MGASPVFVRTAEVGPFASAFWRVFLGLPVLYFWAFAERKRHPAFNFARPVLLAGLFFAGDLIFWHLAILNTTMANATLMACLAPVWVLILSGAFIGESVPRRSFAGLAICLAGAALLVGSSYTIDPARILGDIYGMITSFFFGVYFLAVRVARRSLPGGAFLYSSTLVTAAILFLTAIVAGDGFYPETGRGYASLVALGVVSHAGGQGLLAIALGALSAAFSSLVIFIEALAAAIFGWLIFGEQMGSWQIGGAFLILGGVWIARPRTQTVDLPT